MKHLSKRLLSIVLSLLMVTSVFPALPMTAAAKGNGTELAATGGIVTNLAAGELEKFAYDLIDRTILSGLGKAASATDNENVQKMLNATRKILGGSQGITNSKILSACAEIEQQLSELDVTVRSAAAQTDSMIAELNKLVTEDAFSAQQEKVRSFRENYRSVIDTFAALNTALQKYLTDLDDPSVSESKLHDDYLSLSTAYGKVESFYSTMKTDDLQSEVTINFETDLKNYLMTISPYYFDAALSDDLSDPNGWGEKDNNAKTYLDYAHDYFKSGVVGENQMYDYMTSAITDAAAPLINYLSAYQLYAEYKASLLNADPDYCQDEDAREKALSNTWTLYDKAQRQAIRGVYQLSSLYQDELASMMRDYDVSQWLDMDFQQQEDHVVEKNVTKTLRANATRDTRLFYLLKPYGTGSVYAVSNYDNNLPLLDDRYLVYDYLYNDYTMSQDFFNLQRTNDNSKDRGFKTIASGTELNDLLAPNAWKLVNYYLDAYLINCAGLEGFADLSADHKASTNDGATLKSGAFLLLDESRYNLDKKTMVLLNDSVQITGSASANEINMSLGEIVASENKPVNIIMKNFETISRSIGIQSSGAQTALYSGSSKLTDGGSVKVDSGTVLELRMTPDGGKAIDKIELIRSDGRVLTTLFNSTASVTDPDTHAASSIDVGDTLCQNSDGSCTLMISMPYQDCTVKVSTKNDNTPKRHLVRLLSSFSGDLQFESHDSLALKEFAEGETVTVYARPYTGNAVADVQLLDSEDGDPKDHVLSGVTLSPSDAELYAPTERAYSFTMPSQDVYVMATYAAGYQLRFDTDSFLYDENDQPVCYLSRDTDYVYSGWDDIPVCYLPGETATFVAVTDKNHYMKAVTAQGLTTEADVPVSVKDFVYSVTFDAEDPESILVTPQFEKLSGLQRATVNEQGRCCRSIYLADEDGKSIESDQAVYSPGETVTLNALNNEVLENGITITAEDGSALSDPPEVSCHADSMTITFTMPDQSILITTTELHPYSNGFCTVCGHYQTPKQDENGVYQIKNGGNLFWLGALVNDNHTHADFGGRNQSAQAVLVNDIDLENRQWDPIGTYSKPFYGSLEGNGYTIDNFLFHKETSDYTNRDMFYGLIGYGQYTTLQNFSLKGKAELIYTCPEGANPDDIEMLIFSSIVGNGKDLNLSYINSYVDITAETSGSQFLYICTSGIVNSATGETNVIGCVNFGNISGTLGMAAGVVQSIAYNHGTVKDCANIGSISSDLYDPESGVPMIGGISVLDWDSLIDPDDSVSVHDSYNYGKLTGDESGVLTPILPLAFADGVDNCFHLDSSVDRKNGSTPHTADQFKSGQTGWELNHGVTDGTQSWYQNIDNGKTPDDYPLHDLLYRE